MLDISRWSQDLNLAAGARLWQKWRQEHDTEGYYTVFSAKKQREMSSGSQLTSFLFSLGLQPIKLCLSQHKCAFVLQPILENSLRSGLRLVSVVILSLTKLTIKIDHHLPNELGT